MSSDVAAAEIAPMKQLDKNAQAAEEAKKMLAELQSSAESTTTEKANGDVLKDSTDLDDGQNTSPQKANTDVLKDSTAVDDEHIQTTSDKKEEAQSGRQNDRRYNNEGRSSRGGRGGFQSKTYRENIKSDLTSQEESSDPVAIRKQVEFYFSDSNLPMDKFLLSKVGGSQNHPVELKTIHSFKRMRHFQPFEAIVTAMKDSTILELTDDDTCVKRREPLPEALNDGPDPNAVRVFEDRAMPRSIYAKGFGEEQPSTQFDIEEFFAQYGPTNAIRLRRSDTKIFKGSVFVEFATQDLQKAFLELDPKPQFKGKDLQIMSKKEYCDGKVEDIKAGKIRANDTGKFRGRGGDRHHSGRDKRKRDDEDDRDWRTRREDDRKNGFRDRDDRRGGRRRGSPDYDAGGRGHRGHKQERDNRGVPVVQASEDTPAESKAKRDTATADAIAKARAMVEAEDKKSAVENGDASKSEDKAAKAEPKPKTGESSGAKSGAVNGDSSKKRAREEDEEAAPVVKKVDTKSETATVEATS